jgi:hypothetical protein
VTSDLLFHPVFDKANTPARISYRTRAHPAPQDRVNELDHPSKGLRRIPAKNLLPLSHQCRALPQPGRIPRPPGPWAAPEPPAVKAQEAQALSLDQVDAPAFLLMDGDLELGQFFSEASGHGLEEPIMLRIGIHQDHEVISTPSRFEGGIRSTAGDLLGLLQPPIPRSAIQMTAERRAHPAWRHSLLARSVQHQLEHGQHVRIVDPRCSLRQEQVRPDSIAVRLSIHVNDAGLVLHNRLRHPQDRVMGGALGALAVRPRLEVRCKEGFQDQREGSLDHTVTDRRHRPPTDPFPPFLGNRLVP